MCNREKVCISECLLNCMVHIAVTCSAFSNTSPLTISSHEKQVFCFTQLSLLIHWLDDWWAKHRQNSSSQSWQLGSSPDQILLKCEGWVLNLSPGLNSPVPVIAMLGQAKPITVLKSDRFSDPLLANSSPVNHMSVGHSVSVSFIFLFTILG